jgi:hypothetical protein
VTELTRVENIHRETLRQGGLKVARTRRMTLHVKNSRPSGHHNGLSEDVVFHTRISGNGDSSFEHHRSSTGSNAGFKCDPVESLFQERRASCQYGSAISYFNFSSRVGWTEDLNLDRKLFVCRDRCRCPDGLDPGILVGPGFERQSKYRNVFLSEARQHFREVTGCFIPIGNQNETFQMIRSEMMQGAIQCRCDIGFALIDGFPSTSAGMIGDGNLSKGID